MLEYSNLKEFEQFMADRNLVPEAHGSFYVNWVRRFLNAKFSSGELEDQDKVECFSDQLARDSSVQHADVSTTMIYTHVMNRPGLSVRSPADLL